MLKVVSTIKSGVIYLLSVVLAFAAGFGVAYELALKALREAPPRRNGRVSYRDYYDHKKEEEP